MKILSLAIVISSLIIGGSYYYTTLHKQKVEQQAVDKNHIFKITDSGNLVRYNKDNLEMTICGLSDGRYRCMHFKDNSSN